MRILVFSDIHRDATALSRLMDIEADLYVAAGDLCTFAKGLDPLAPILARRTEKMWVLPGNHEHASQVDEFCRRYGFQTLHRKSFLVGGVHLAGLGHSNPTPFNTPGEDSEETIAANLDAFAGLKSTGPDLPLPAPGHPARRSRAGPALRFARGARVHR